MTNLPIASRRYLLGMSDEREYCWDELNGNRLESVFPLLKEALHIYKEFHPVANLRNVDLRHIVGESPRNFWVRYVVEPAIKDIYEILSSGGSEVHDSLVRALYDQDPFVKITSAMVLLEFRNPSRKLVEQLARTIEYLKTTEQKKPYYRDSGLIVILFLVLYQGGNQEAKGFIEGMLRKENMNYETMRLMWRNTMFNYLFSALSPS